MNQHIASIRSYVAVFVALLLLLFATVAAAYLPMGPLHFPVAMAIAAAKAVLIVLIFMHALHSHRFTVVVCAASLLWLAIMLALTLSDYHSRGWLDIPGK
jgi:cytochrome c oxidase subunit IV